MQGCGVLGRSVLLRASFVVELSCSKQRCPTSPLDAEHHSLRLVTLLLAISSDGGFRNWGYLIKWPYCKGNPTIGGSRLGSLIIAYTPRVPASHFKTRFLRSASGGSHGVIFFPWGASGALSGHLFERVQGLEFRV